MRILCLLAFVTVAALMVAPGGASAGGLHPCGDLFSSNARDIKANFKCSKAKGVVRRFECDGDGDCFSGGFDCSFKSTGIEEGVLRCKRDRDDRVVRWITFA